MNKDFKQFLQNARDSFCTVIARYDPSYHNRLRTVSDDLLNAFDQVVYYQRWERVDLIKPRYGVNLILHNPKWICEDFNPRGIRYGFLNGDDSWISTYYDSCGDCYSTRDSEQDNQAFENPKAVDQIPTHWMEIPHPTNLITNRIEEPQKTNNQ